MLDRTNSTLPMSTSLVKKQKDSSIISRGTIAYINKMCNPIYLINTFEILKLFLLLITPAACYKVVLGIFL
jgi:hypothetical protein